jgi:hypothetical protein
MNVVDLHDARRRRDLLLQCDRDGELVLEEHDDDVSLALLLSLDGLLEAFKGKSAAQRGASAYLFKLTSRGRDACRRMERST